jgi:SAM-dependent methyltransferase
MGVASWVRVSALTVSRTLERVASGFNYAATGTMHLSELRAETIRIWADYAATDADVFAGWARWEYGILRFINAGERVLVVGCGTGRDLLALADMGCQVTGVDPVPGAIATARRIMAERAVAARILEGWFEDVAVNGEFDVVNFSGLCYGFMPERRRRTAALRKARMLAAHGGRIIVSYASRARQRRSRGVMIGRLVGSAFRTDWRLEDGDKISKNTAALMYEHWFAPGDLEAEAAAAGLRVTFQGADPVSFAVLVPDDACVTDRNT